MADKVGDEFEGYITGVAPFGLFIELIEHYVEGLVHVSSMADDYYRFVEQQHVLRGENTKKVYRLGDKVLVQVVRVDMERRQVDLGLVEILETVRRDERRRGADAASSNRRRKRRKRSAGRREAQAASRPARARRGSKRYDFSSSLVASLKFLMPLPMPLPISGSRLAPKIRMMITRMMSSSGRPMRPISHLRSQLSRERRNCTTAGAAGMPFERGAGGRRHETAHGCRGGCARWRHSIAVAQQEGPLAQFSSQVQLVEVYATVTDDKASSSPACVKTTSRCTRTISSRRSRHSPPASFR